MIFKKLLNTKHPLSLIIFHILLGVISAFSKYVFVFYFYLLLFDFTFIFFNLNENLPKFIYSFSYLLSFEVLARILNCSPWIPYEMSKYLMFFILAFGLLTIKNKNSKYGPLLLILILPSIFYDYSGKVIFEDLIFNLLGTINLILSIWFFSSLRFKFINYPYLLRFLLLPLISTLILTIIKSPDFSEVTFNLGASEDFTGGFGSNQVSTVYGIGFLLISIIILNGWTLSSYKFLDYILLILFFVFALLSFSRGGVFGGIIGFLVYFILVNVNKKRQITLIRTRKVNIISITIFISFLLLFSAINIFTNNSLLLRYEGQTVGTIDSGEKIDFNKYTTGRFSILEGEFDLFFNYLFGVGAGASQYLRSTKEGTSTHSEMGRLLSEHGLLGIIFFFILIYLFFNISFLSTKNISLIFSSTFIFLAIYSSFHAATRTYVTPLFFGLGMMNVYIIYNYSNNSLIEKK